MKAFRLLLLLAAGLLLVVIFRPLFSIPFDKNGRPVLFDDDDEFCAVPYSEVHLETEGRVVSSGPA